MVNKGHFHMSDVTKMISVVSSVSDNPSRDMLIQAVDNSIDAIGPTDQPKIISVYKTKVTGLDSIVIEDSGHGMNREFLENYKDLANSLKKWTRSRGFLGIGRFAYIVQGKSGVFLETRTEDGYEDWGYIFVDGKSSKEEITFRSDEPYYEVWDIYSEWLRKNRIPPIERGTRVLIWNVDEFTMKEVESKAATWISRSYPEHLDDVEIYVENERIFSKPPSTKQYERTVKGKVDGIEWKGKVFYCKNPVEDPGIGVRAVNRTVEYTFFNISGYENIKSRLWGYIDLNDMITEDMVNAAKDGIKDGPLKSEIWKSARVDISRFCGYCEEMDASKKEIASSKGLSGISKICGNVMKALERPPDLIVDENDTPHKELEKRDMEPMEERGNDFVCKRCGRPMSKKPSEEGKIRNLDMLKRTCPCCGISFKLKAHRSALSKNYRIYICSKCGHHHFHLDQQTSEFKFTITKNWKYDKNEEFHWEKILYINQNHINFKTANEASKKSTKVSWPNLSEPMDILHTPLESYLVNCAALAFAIREVGEDTKIEIFMKEYNRYRTAYSQELWKLRALK